MSEKRQIDIDDCKKESRDRAKFYTYLLMSGLVIAWGFDYVVAKHVLTILQPLGLLFFKYTVGMVLIICIKLKTDRKSIEMCIRDSWQRACWKENHIRH